MQLKDIRPQVRYKKSKRVGRGPGSGHGKTSGKGHKGAKARSGRLFYIGFEGGSLPFLRKLPKRGFNHRKRLKYQIVNTQDLNSRCKPNDEVNPQSLFSLNLIKNKDGLVKILGKGILEKSLVVYAHKFSKLAEAKISKTGGKINLIKQKD